jgi:hypothetical protein
MAGNEIAQLETVELQSASGPVVAIMIAVNIGDARRAEAFVGQVTEKFKVHRTCSPPETSYLLVTIIGDMTAQQFATCWKALVAEDPILETYLSMMHVADVLHGTSRGEVLDSASLLA